MVKSKAERKPAQLAGYPGVSALLLEAHRPTHHNEQVRFAQVQQRNRRISHIDTVYLVVRRFNWLTIPGNALTGNMTDDQLPLGTHASWSSEPLLFGHFELHDLSFMHRQQDLTEAQTIKRRLHGSERCGMPITGFSSRIIGNRKSRLFSHELFSASFRMSFIGQEIGNGQVTFASVVIEAQHARTRWQIGQLLRDCGQSCP